MSAEEGEMALRVQQAGRLAEAARLAWGIFFLGSAAFNALVTAPDAEAVFTAFVGLSWTQAAPLVRAILPVAAAFTLLVVGFEVVVGLLILSRRTARLGVIISLAWLAALVPFLGSYGLVNVALIPAVALLLRRSYDRTP